MSTVSTTDTVGGGGRDPGGLLPCMLGQDAGIRYEHT